MRRILNKAPSQASRPSVPPEKAADRSSASGTTGDLEAIAKSTLGRIPKEKQPKRTAEEQRAEIERVAREHGADLSEEGFNEALRKVRSAKA